MTTRLERAVGCVIVNYNGLEDTLACLASLQNLDIQPINIVVENGSTDGSWEGLRSTGTTTLLRSETNLGYGGGANLGIEEALRQGCSYIWLLNNDTVVEPDALRELLEPMEREPSLGGVASAILRMSDGTVEAYAGGAVNGWLGSTMPYTTPRGRPLDYLACASALIRAEVFRGVGLFDEIFFAYYEDIDLSVRMQRAGWELGTATGSRVHHKGGATANEGQAKRSLWADLTYVESSGAFLGKHLDARKTVGVPLRIAAMVGVRIWRRQWTRIPTVLLRFLRGFRRGLSRRTG